MKTIEMLSYQEVMEARKERIERNKRLVEQFPFLLPRNRFTGKVSTDYDYSYTELDDMPAGWRKAFGEQMCQEIKDELVRIGHLGTYRIIQIKEKYGSLRWYDNGGTEKMHLDIIPRYEALSSRTCIVCGAPGKMVFEGWMCPYCDRHAPNRIEVQ